MSLISIGFSPYHLMLSSGYTYAGLIEFQLTSNITDITNIQGEELGRIAIAKQTNKLRKIACSKIAYSPKDILSFTITWYNL